MIVGLHLAKQGGKNWGLYGINLSPQNYLALLSAAYSDNDFRTLGAFIQSDSCPLAMWEKREKIETNVYIDTSFVFIEFWSNNEEKILEVSLQFAKSITQELIID